MEHFLDVIGIFVPHSVVGPAVDVHGGADDDLGKGNALIS